MFQWEVLQRLPIVFVNGRTKVYFLKTWVVNLSCCSVLFIYFPLERLHGIQLCSDADFYSLNVKSLSYGFCLYLFAVCDFMDSCLLIRAWKNIGFCETQLSFLFCFCYISVRLWVIWSKLSSCLASLRSWHQGTTLLALVCETWGPLTPREDREN